MSGGDGRGHNTGAHSTSGNINGGPTGIGVSGGASRLQADQAFQMKILPSNRYQMDNQHLPTLTHTEESLFP